MVHVLVAVFLFGMLLVPDHAHAISINQIDTFEDGSTANWKINLVGLDTPPPVALPTNITTGGPAGAGDNFLLLTAVGGSGPGSRLTALNDVQWAGDYPAAGVGAIAMNVNNLGGTDLSLRLAFEHAVGGPPIDVAFSTDSVLVPSGSGWISVLFPIAGTDLTAGIGSVTGALSNTTILRLYHSPALNFPNPVFAIPAVSAQLGVDNIVAVPEPSTWLLVGSALALVGARRILKRTLSSE